MKNYRPISNFSVISKLLEHVILPQLLEHLKVIDLLPSVQSAYRKCHSTETAIARVLSDIPMALDRGDVAALALMDLSAAFDTVDHCILLRSLCVSYGISGAALSWISSYLTDRQQCVWHDGVQSTHEFIKFGVLQGSILRLLLFVLYASDRQTSSAFPPVCGRYAGLRLVSTCHGASTMCGGGCAATGYS